jgi:hypothetical protein
MPTLFVVRAVRCIVAGVLLTQAAGIAAAQTPNRHRSSTPIACKADGKATPLPNLAEASGVTAGRDRPSVLWAHNDSGGEPRVLGLDQAGTVDEFVQLIGAVVEDWEDIAAGACSQGSCLYVADIGDNDAKREHITVYRFPEPVAESRPRRASCNWRPHANAGTDAAGKGDQKVDERGGSFVTTTIMPPFTGTG